MFTDNFFDFYILGKEKITFSFLYNMVKIRRRKRGQISAKVADTVVMAPGTYNVYAFHRCFAPRPRLQWSSGSVPLHVRQPGPGGFIQFHLNWSVHPCANTCISSPVYCAAIGEVKLLCHKPFADGRGPMTPS